MKGLLKICLMLVVAFAFRIDAQTGYYGQLTYRANDPFLFCREGQDLQQNPAPCWKPIPPYTGAYIMMPYCRPPNPYGKDWTQDDTNSLAEYLRTCPHAEKSGNWQGQGSPDTTPFKH